MENIDMVCPVLTCSNDCNLHVAHSLPCCSMQLCHSAICWREEGEGKQKWEFFFNFLHVSLQIYASWCKPEERKWEELESRVYRILVLSSATRIPPSPSSSILAKTLSHSSPMMATYWEYRVPHHWQLTGSMTPLATYWEYRSPGSAPLWLQVAAVCYWAQPGMSHPARWQSGVNFAPLRSLLQNQKKSIILGHMNAISNILFTFTIFLLSFMG